MKNFKKQNGITLVALVVTIIVLLILAGVSLSLVAGENGILKRATNAVDKNEIGTAREQAGLLISDLITGYYEAKYVNTESDNTANAKEYVVHELGTTGRNTDSGDYVVKNETNTTSGYDIIVEKTSSNTRTNAASLRAKMSEGGKLSDWQYQSGTEWINLDKTTTTP